MSTGTKNNLNPDYGISGYFVTDPNHLFQSLILIPSRPGVFLTDASRRR